MVKQMASIQSAIRTIPPSCAGSFIYMQQFFCYTDMHILNIPNFQTNLSISYYFWNICKILLYSQRLTDIELGVFWGEGSCSKRNKSSQVFFTERLEIVLGPGKIKMFVA